jgi:hypothetical protein
LREEHAGERLTHRKIDLSALIVELIPGKLGRRTRIFQPGPFGLSGPRLIIWPRTVAEGFWRSPAVISCAWTAAKCCAADCNVGLAR